MTVTLGSEIGAVVADLEISRAWLVDPASGREGPGEIVVTNGVLEAVTWLDADEADGVDDGGVVVAPGFVDLHVHFREPGNEDAETVASGLAAAAHGGFTTVCLMPNTTPALDDPAVLARVRAAALASGSPVRALAWGAITAGRSGETLAAIGELADAGVAGFSDDGAGVASAITARKKDRDNAALKQQPRDGDREWSLAGAAGREITDADHREARAVGLAAQVARLYDPSVKRA